MHHLYQLIICVVVIVRQSLRYLLDDRREVVLWEGLHEGLPDGEGKWLDHCHALEDVRQSHVHQPVVLGPQIPVLFDSVDELRDILRDVVDLNLCLLFHDLQLLVEQVPQVLRQALHVVEVEHVDGQFDCLGVGTVHWVHS